MYPVSFRMIVASESTAGFFELLCFTYGVTDSRRDQSKQRDKNREPMEKSTSCRVFKVIQWYEKRIDWRRKGDIKNETGYEEWQFQHVWSYCISNKGKLRFLFLYVTLSERVMSMMKTCVVFLFISFLLNQYIYMLNSCSKFLILYMFVVYPASTCWW